MKKKQTLILLLMFTGFMNPFVNAQTADTLYLSKTTGCISGDCQNGYGVFANDNFRYEGNFKDGKRDGQGKATYSYGDVFDGNWSNDKQSAFGTYIWKSGEKYAGNYVNGREDGEATYYKPDGSIEYHGHYRKGNRIDINSPDYPFWESLNKIMDDFANGFKSFESDEASDKIFCKVSTINLPGCKKAYIEIGVGREYQIWSDEIICDGTEQDALNKYHEFGERIKNSFKDCGSFSDDKLEEPAKGEDKILVYQRWWMPSYVTYGYDKKFKYLLINLEAKKRYTTDEWMVSIYINYNLNIK